VKPIDKSLDAHENRADRVWKDGEGNRIRCQRKGSRGCDHDTSGKANFKEISQESLRDVDVAIDFTHPSVVIGNIKKIAEQGVNMVIGTTGWYDRMKEVEGIVDEKGIGLIWSGNFSIGVNVFFRIIESAASLIDGLPEYDIAIHEVHHSKKTDSPSGTAQMIGDIILKSTSRKTVVNTEKLDRPIRSEELHITSERIGSVPGIHTVTIDSSADTIELKHTARTRAGFALGAVMAAEFIKGKKGLYSIDDLMNTIVGA
jgi:4-hydroxy-tetrahydrodipicolinate reductase